MNVLDMKILEIKDNKGYFLSFSDKSSDTGKWMPIDQINKDDLMALLDIYIDDQDVKMDEYNEDLIKNQVHQIIYKNIFNKFSSLRDRRNKFKDEGDRLYLKEIQKYQVQEMGEL